MGSYPLQAEEMTAGWLTQVLHTSGELGADHEISSISWSYIGEGIGLLGAVVRVALNYTAPGAGPESLIVKFAHPNPENRQIGNNAAVYEREVMFYNDMAGQIDVPMPKCHFALMDFESGGDVIVLEDLRDYKLGDQVTGISVDQPRMVIDALAPMHAMYWGTAEEHFPAAFVIDSPKYTEPFLPSFMGTWEAAMTNFADLFPPELVAVMPDYVAGLHDIMRNMTNRTTTLVHGDARMDNAMFGAGRAGLTDVILIDWQNPMVSNPLQDVAWMMVSSVTTDVRREHEDVLLQHYVDVLRAHGVSDYTIEQCNDDYDAAILFLLNFTMIMAGGFDMTSDRGKKLVAGGLQRTINAVCDRGLISLIPAP